ncbi:hypothetical protein L2W01_13600 [Staphylococcus aureus]|nr:hypothetical protein [Staphylococcus aureus]MDN4125442.1 hypothetical protein [Staphylococcus aureus]
MSNNRGKSAAERLLGAGKKNTNSHKSTPTNDKETKTTQEFVMNKKNIEKLIKQQGNSKRNADSIRINPILANALKYWTSIAEPEKSKPDVIEETLLKTIPEEYLIQGYEMAKKQNKI